MEFRDIHFIWEKVSSFGSVSFLAWSLINSALAVGKKTSFKDNMRGTNEWSYDSITLLNYG